MLLLLLWLLAFFTVNGKKGWACPLLTAATCHIFFFFFFFLLSVRTVCLHVLWRRDCSVWCSLFSSPQNKIQATLIAKDHRNVIPYSFSIATIFCNLLLLPIFEYICMYVCRCVHLCVNYYKCVCVLQLENTKQHKKAFY